MAKSHKVNNNELTYTGCSMSLRKARWVVGFVWKNIKTRNPVSMSVIKAARASLLWAPKEGRGSKNMTKKQPNSRSWINSWYTTYSLMWSQRDSDVQLAYNSTIC